MKTILKNNAVFIGLCLAMLLTLGVVLLVYPKPDIHLWLNQYHRPFLDTFFSRYTVVGEYCPYIIAVLLLFYKAGWAAFFAADAALCTLVGQIIKHIVNAPRPLVYFAEHFPDIQLPLVEGVRMNHYFSFPSGHTISFFATFFALCIIATDYLDTKKDKMSPANYQLSSINCQLLFFLLAVLGAYSRIYLSQHFAMDIFGGATLSFIITLLLCLLLPLVNSKKWFNWHFLQKKT